MNPFDATTKKSGMVVGLRLDDIETNGQKISQVMVCNLLNDDGEPDMTEGHRLWADMEASERIPYLDVLLKSLEEGIEVHLAYESTEDVGVLGDVLDVSEDYQNLPQNCEKTSGIVSKLQVEREPDQIVMIIGISSDVLGKVKNVRYALKSGSAVGTVHYRLLKLAKEKNARLGVRLAYQKRLVQVRVESKG